MDPGLRIIGTKKKDYIVLFPTDRKKYMIVYSPLHTDPMTAPHLTVTYCDVFGDNRDFDPTKLKKHAQVASALRNTARVEPDTRLWGPSQMILELIPLDNQACDNCRKTHRKLHVHYVFHNDASDFNLCINCYKTLRYVEPAFRWDGVFHCPDLADAMKDDIEGIGILDDTIDEMIKERTALDIVIDPNRADDNFQPHIPAPLDWPLDARIEDWGQHKNEVSTKLL